MKKLSTNDCLNNIFSLLEEGHPFEAHELAEDFWKMTVGKEKEIFQGLAQIGAALTHLERGNPEGTKSLWDRAQPKLKALPPDLAARLAKLRPF